MRPAALRVELPVERLRLGNPGQPSAVLCSRHDNAM